MAFAKTALKKYRFSHFSFSIEENEEQGVRLIFHISGKHFNAVKRNYIKRRIREYFRKKAVTRNIIVRSFLRKPFPFSDKSVIVSDLDCFSECL